MKDINSMLLQYAGTVSVNYNALTYLGKAFITPLRYKNRVYLDGMFDEIGRLDRNNYLYIGSPKLRIDKMDETAVISYGGDDYLIRQAELFSVGDEPLYMWAILAKCKDGE